MNALRLLPVILSLLVFGAHFLRVGNFIATGICVALIFLLFLRERWVPTVIQVVLLVAAAVWLRTLYVLIGERSELGQSWTVAAIILGSVAAFTVLSTLVFRGKALKRYYLSSNELTFDKKIR